MNMLPGSKGFNRANSIVLHEAENSIEDDKTILLGWALRQIESLTKDAPAVVVPEIADDELRKMILSAARRKGCIDFDPEDVSDGDLEILREIRDDLAKLFRATPAHRELGEGMVAVDRQLLLDVEDALGHAERLGPCGLGLLCQVQDALRANQGGAAT